MSLMSRGMTWLTTRTRTAGGVPVTYTRGAQSVPLTAVPGEVADEVPASAPPTRATTTRRDYLVGVADLAAAGIVGPPLVGDRLTETIGGTPAVFEVCPRSDAPGWRYSDADRTTYRVFTTPVS